MAPRAWKRGTSLSFIPTLQPSSPAGATRLAQPHPGPLTAATVCANLDCHRAFGEDAGRGHQWPYDLEPQLPPAVATMDAFLLDAPEPDHACVSTEDLALEMAQLRNAKVTDTKAEHISATFEFSSTVVFSVQENENEVAESQNPDQSAGGPPGAAPPAPMNGDAPAPATREIRAIDTLLNQPTDDPALQKLVAKHIIASLGSVDGSSWTVRSVSRNSSGWTFTYLCKHSTQAWMRQNSKHSAKLRIAESSGKDGQDAVNLCERMPQNPRP